MKLILIHFYEKQEETKLDDGTVIEAITSDSPAIEQPQISIRATSTKKYRSRIYIIKLRLYHVLYLDGWTVLNTYYNVGNSGLTATSTSAAGTKAVFHYKFLGTLRLLINVLRKLAMSQTDKVIME